MFLRMFSQAVLAPARSGAARWSCVPPLTDSAEIAMPETPHPHGWPVTLRTGSRELGSAEPARQTTPAPPGEGQSCTVCPFADNTGPPAVITMNAPRGLRHARQPRRTPRPLHRTAKPDSTGQAGEPLARRADYALPPESRARPRHNNQDSPADSGVTTPDAARVHDCYRRRKDNYEAGRQAARRGTADGTRRAYTGVARQPAGDQR